MLQIFLDSVFFGHSVFFNFILLLNQKLAGSSFVVCFFFCWLFLTLFSFYFCFPRPTLSCVCVLEGDAKSKLIKKFNFLGKFNFAQGKFNLLAFAGFSFIFFSSSFRVIFLRAFCGRGKLNCSLLCGFSKRFSFADFPLVCER